MFAVLGLAILCGGCPVALAQTVEITATVAPFGGTLSVGAPYNKSGSSISFTANAGAAITITATLLNPTTSAFVSWTENDVALTASTDLNFTTAAGVNRDFVANFNNPPRLVSAKKIRKRSTVKFLATWIPNIEGADTFPAFYYGPTVNNQDVIQAEDGLGNRGMRGTFPVTVSAIVSGLPASYTLKWRAFAGTNGITTSDPPQNVEDPNYVFDDGVDLPTIDLDFFAQVRRSATSATLSADVLPVQNEATAVLEYGLSAAYGSTSGPIALTSFGDGSLNSRRVDFLLTALSPSTTYHYRVKADNRDTSGAGGETATGDRTFTTLARPYIVAVSASPPHGGTVSGGGMFAEFGVATVIATPNSGFAFVNFTEAGVQVSTSRNITFGVGGDRTLVANFAVLPGHHTIAASASPANGGTVSGAGAFPDGQNVTLVATPNSGFTFLNWTEGTTIASTTASYSFPANADRNLVANFIPVGQTYLLTLSATGDANGFIFTDPEGEFVAAPAGVRQRRFPAGTVVSLDPFDARGYFVRWSDDASGSAVPLAVTMDRDKSVSAEFVPYAAAAGTYRGTITDATGAPVGLIVGTVTRTGRYTLVIYRRGQIFRRAGPLFDDGKFSVSILDALTSQNLELIFTFNTQGSAISLEQVVNATRSAAGSIRRAFTLYSSKNPAPPAGRYTLLLPADATQLGLSTYPQGTGYATLVISTTGVVSVTGKAGDGTALSLRSAVIDQDDLVPLYTRLYASPPGYLAGTLDLRRITDASDADGRLRWLKPPQVRVQPYQAGFVGTVAAVGSRYTAPTLVAPGNLRLSQGGLLGPLQRAITVPLRSGAVVQIPGEEKLALKFNALNGLFTGSLTPGALANPADPRRRSISGALFQTGRVAGGLFTAPNGTGKLEIALAP